MTDASSQPMDASSSGADAPPAGPLTALRSWFDDEAHPRAAPVLQLVLLALLYSLLHRLTDGAWELPEEVYAGPVIGLGAAGFPKAVAVVLVPTALLALGRKRVAWSALGPPMLRVLMVAAAVPVVWHASLLPYNFYLGSWHAVDRVALVAALVLFARHPMWVAVVAGGAAVLGNQIDHPMANLSSTDRRLAFEALAAFETFVLARLLLPTLRWERFFQLLLCVAAAFYFEPGRGKMKLDWLEHVDLVPLFLAANANGWLGFLDPDRVGLVAAVLERLGFLLCLLTLVLEYAAPVLLFARWLVVVFLLGLVGMHLGIFSSSGIFFLKWIWLDLAVVAALLWMAPAARARVFDRRAAVAGVLLVVLGHDAIFDAIKLAWYTAPVAHLPRVEAVGQDGVRYQVPPSHLAPFDFPMAQGRFAYLSHEPVVVRTYGATKDLACFQALEAATDRPALDAAIDRCGEVKFDPERHERMRHFLATYFANHRADPERGSWLDVLAFPQHKWTGPHGPLPVWDRREPIERVRVRWETRWLPLDRATVLHDEVVLEVEIEPRTSGASAAASASSG